MRFQLGASVSGLSCLLLGEKLVFLWAPVIKEVVPGSDILGSCEADIHLNSADLWMRT